MTTDKVTLKDVYAIVNRIEDKIDSRFNDVDERIVKLESRLSNLEGRAVVFGAISGIILTIITNFIIGKV